MIKFLRHEAERRRGPETSLTAGALALLLLPMACVGTIEGPRPGKGDLGNPAGVGGNGPRGTGGTGGNRPPPPPRPEMGEPPSGPIESRAGASSRLSRLNHKQWENTVKDLLRLPQPSGLSRQFLAEPVRSSFDNHGGSLEVSSQLWPQYQRAAEQLATQVVRNAAAFAKIQPKAPPADQDGRARAFITEFGLRAFRRPLTPNEVTQHLLLFKEAARILAGPDPFADGAEVVVASFLQSPHFLYRTELGQGSALGDYEIATRLSYGLTGSMPDDALFAAAGAKRLHTREEVAAAAGRLLDSPAGQATLRDLHDQMMAKVDPSELVRNASLHPQWKAGIGLDMKEERLAFIREVIYGQRKGVRDLLTASFTFVNSKLAPLYGIKANPVAAGQSDPLVKVDLDPEQRGGLYTQAGFLATTASDWFPRSIVRGVHMAEHVLCAELQPPPPDVDTNLPAVQKGKTNRQQLEAMTEKPGTNCQVCHGNYINPLGFAFEHYDGMGKFRNDENGLPIDASSSYDFGSGEKQAFGGAIEFLKIVAETQAAHDCYSQQLFEYVYGRPADHDSDADKGLIEALGHRSKFDWSIKQLLVDMVATNAFLTRQP